MNFQALAKKVLHRAKRKGAQQAEVFIQQGRESSCSVREGEIEDLTEATSKGLGLRVLVKNRLGFAYSSDFSPDAVNDFVDRAVALAQAAAANRLNGLPTRKDSGKPPPIGELFDPKVAALPSDWKIRAAKELERAGKAVDPRIKTFDSVGAGENVGEVYMASTEGLSGGYSGTHVYLYAVPVASEGEQLQTSYWVDYKRYFDDLDSPEEIGKEAARRALRMLGARKVPTQRVPVIFDPLMSASFVGAVASAASGDSVHKQSSFLAPLLGRKIAPDTLTLLDDGHLERGLGTAPFDGEGVATQRTAIIEEGVLKHFLYDWFTAKKAKAQTTGNASRSYRSLPGIGTHNLYLQPGNLAPEEIIKGVKRGLYVTAMLGQGANIVTGEYSRGANGMWIENGELAYPVQEVTVAGTIPQMLAEIDAIGSDLQFRGSTGAPTIRFRELTISGA